jgi:hypothetical protein
VLPGGELEQRRPPPLASPRVEVVGAAPSASMPAGVRSGCRGGSEWPDPRSSGVRRAACLEALLDSVPMDETAAVVLEGRCRNREDDALSGGAEVGPRAALLRPLAPAGRFRDSAVLRWPRRRGLEPPRRSEGVGGSWRNGELAGVSLSAVWPFRPGSAGLRTEYGLTEGRRSKSAALPTGGARRR